MQMVQFICAEDQGPVQRFHPITMHWNQPYGDAITEMKMGFPVYC